MTLGNLAPILSSPADVTLNTAEPIQTRSVRDASKLGYFRLEDKLPQTISATSAHARDKQNAICHTGTMDDLVVPAGPGIPKGLVVPAKDLVEQFTHASGPGGQGVNTTDSRVQLSLDLGATAALTETQRNRVLRNLEHRLSETTLTVTAAEHRSQLRNRKAARQRLASILRDALAPQPVRRKTKPTRGSQRRRLAAKRQRAEIKQNRKRPPMD